MSLNAIGNGTFLGRKKGRKTRVAKLIRIKTENQASTWPAKYTPIKLKEKAQSKVIESKYDMIHPYNISNGCILNEIRYQ
ncbi:hypothetical protein GCM10007855_21300 [Aliivibrio sifiae]|uniref:Transposase n=1 Tax=Aliivibrio sifiae TaxID=566293 RepID=A0ABQ6AK54_9GAMM|nr:hypothetical protein GCM10007855_21300 [Aliivibrio sifiae]